MKVNQMTSKQYICANRSDTYCESGIKLCYNLVEEVFILGEEYNSTPVIVV